MSHQRTDRVRELIKEEVSRIVQSGLSDPRIGLVTITDAEVSVDLRYAKIFFTVLGDEAARHDCLEGLRSAARFVRGEVGRNVRLKYTPEIHFEFDGSLDQAMRIEELLTQIHVTEDSDAQEDLFPSETPKEDRINSE